MTTTSSVAVSSTAHEPGVPPRSSTTRSPLYKTAPRRERMACRFRPVDRNASAVLHIEKYLFSRARGDKNSGNVGLNEAGRIGKTVGG